MSQNISLQSLLDGLGHAVLIFSHDDRLVQHNITAGTLLGTDLHLMRSEGWIAAVQLFDSDVQLAENALNAVRQRALTSERPVRFSTVRAGEYIACWAAAVSGEDGSIATVIVMDIPDWKVVSNVLDRFNQEMNDAVQSTVGHITLINKALVNKNDDEATAKLARRVGGFSKLISIHMKRAERLMTLTERLEELRMGVTRSKATESRAKINLNDFLDDFLEALDDSDLIDPETTDQDFRGRIKRAIPGDARVYVSRRYLTFALQELLRNAIMYSMRGTPITIRATAKGSVVQIDVMDEGYGIRDTETDRVFRLFDRGRQPQVISEFGYGMGLYLCKHEINIMNGKLWFTTIDNLTTTFSMLLPAPVESSASVSTPA